MIQIENLPSAVTQSTRAVVWNYEDRNGARTKVPYDPHQPSAKAAVNNPNTWGTFAEALAAVEDGKADGVGIVLGEGMAGIDIDDCRDPETGAIAEAALTIVREVDSYTEISPSGCGLHILLRGVLPAGGRRKDNLEVYSDLGTSRSRVNISKARRR